MPLSVEPVRPLLPENAPTHIQPIYVYRALAITMFILAGGFFFIGAQHYLKDDTKKSIPPVTAGLNCITAGVCVNGPLQKAIALWKKYTRNIPLPNTTLHHMRYAGGLIPSRRIN